MTFYDELRRDREAGTPGPWDEAFGTLIPKGGSTNRPIGVRALCLSHYSGPRGNDVESANARRIARVPVLEDIALAAEELAAAVDHERSMVCQDFDMQLQAYNRISAALAKFNETTERRD